MRKAIITGAAGQDGSYLCELLLDKGYEVHGVVRRSSSSSTERLSYLKRRGEFAGRFFLHHGDQLDTGRLVQLLSSVQPDEFYNLAAQSHVRVSFEIPESTVDVTGVAALRILESIRVLGLDTRFYQASSSEMFGSTNPPQNELSQLHPRSPYACAKVLAHNCTVNYRESYGIHAVSGILFNHESPRRGENFVTRKITKAVSAIARGEQDLVYLGNLEAKRDWGFAGDYVDAMWRMLQLDTPDDFVVATGEAHSVREFCELAFGHVGLNWQDHVRYDERFERPAEVDHLLGDASKARAVLDWSPTVTFPKLVTLMVDADLEAKDDRVVDLTTEHRDANSHS